MQILAAGLGQLARRSVAVCRILPQAPQADRFNLGVNVRVQRSRRGRLLILDLVHEGPQTFRLERRSAGERLIQRGSETVDIGPVVDPPLPRELLGAQIGRRADDISRTRQGESRSHIRAIEWLQISFDELGQPIVEEHGNHALVCFPHEDIRRLDIPVNHSFAMGMLERPGDLPGDFDREPGRAFTLLNRFLEAVSLEQLHGVEGIALHLPHIIDADDIGMIECRGRLGLPMESPYRLGLDPVSDEKNFQCYLSSQLPVASPVDDPDASLPDLSQELIPAPVEGPLQPSRA